MKKRLKNIAVSGLIVLGLIGLGIVMGGCSGLATTDSESLSEKIEASVIIKTPEGRTLSLHKGATVYYKGERYAVHKAAPPYVTLRKGYYRQWWPSKGKKDVLITELDFFKETSSIQEDTEDKIFNYSDSDRW
jgi:hypothetical protein